MSEHVYKSNVRSLAPGIAIATELYWHETEENSITR
jgi:hypothetical protein